MFTRRVILLFVLFTLGFVALAVRLSVFQLAQADQWAQQATRFVQRHYLIDTRRGTILDAKGRPLARDEPVLNIVMDFQAMNLDDAWITLAARRRLTQMGITKREDRLARLAEIKDKIADEIDAFPATLVRLYDLARAEKGGESIPPLTKADIEFQFNLARKRIALLKQDQWFKKYNRDDAPQDSEPDTAEDAQITPVAEEMQAQVIVEDVPLTVKIAIDKLKESLPGVDVVQSRRRKYPYGDVAAHVIGTLQSVDEKFINDKNAFSRPDFLTGETGELKGYLPGDKRGSFGIEAYAEDALRGTRGVGLRELGGSDIPEKHIESLPGKDVQLTLDIELQKAIQQELYANEHVLLRGQEGDPNWQSDHNVAIVILRIKDRAVVAVLSTPTYDLNTYQKNILALNTDEANKPLLNRAMRNIYPPGSTVKPLVAAAALTEGTLPSVLTTVLCRGYMDRKGALACTATHGNLALREALEHSCNVFFYTQGRNLGLERLTDWYGRFGFGNITGIGPSEVDGNVPDINAYTNESIMSSEATQLGIGQGKLNVTPLQMANAYATLLEAGQMRAPTLIAGEMKQARQVFTIAPEHLQAIKEGLELVVRGESGTARHFMNGLLLPVAGKTGTAQTELRPVFDETGHRVYRPQLDAEGQPVLGPDGKPVPLLRRDANGKLILDRNNQPIPVPEMRSGDDSWFVGYAPSNDPQYVIAAVKEFGGHGGVTSVPVVRAAIIQMEKQGYLPNVDAR